MGLSQKYRVNMCQRFYSTRSLIKRISKTVRLAKRRIYIVSQLNAEINLLIDTRLANVLQGHKTIVFGGDLFQMLEIRQILTR